MNSYDVRLTIRDFVDKKTILAQYSIRNMEYQNPISTGDVIVIPSLETDFTLEARVEVRHRPYESVLYAEAKAVRPNMDKIKALMENYLAEEGELF